MVGGERLTHRALAEGPGSASVQLHLREAGGVERPGVGLRHGRCWQETRLWSAQGLRAGRAVPQGEAWASQNLQGVCTGWGQNTEALGMDGERQGGGRDGHPQTLDSTWAGAWRGDVVASVDCLDCPLRGDEGVGRAASRTSGPSAAPSGLAFSSQRRGGLDPHLGTSGLREGQGHLSRCASSSFL